jgi:hypothetical protein
VFNRGIAAGQGELRKFGKQFDPQFLPLAWE